MWRRRPEQNITADTTINSLRLGGSTAGTAAVGVPITLGSNTLTLNSGAIYSNASSATTFTGGSLFFGPGGTGDAFITVFGQTLTISSSIHASSLTKSGNNTLILSGPTSFSSPTYINQGAVQVSANNQLGPAVILGSNLLGNGSGGFGGSVRLTGNVSYNIPLTISSGFAAISATSLGALDSASGNNTWSGLITLTGNGLNSNERQLNSISVESGSTLVASGMIVEGGSTSIGLVKTGPGTLVLTGAQPNTFTELFRQFGGLIILEKDAALGTSNPLIVDGNFIQNSTIGTLAFRAPASSPGGFNYATREVLNLNGVGLNGMGNLDNLSGANSFGGNVALGPGFTVGSFFGCAIGVSVGSLELDGQIDSTTTALRDLVKTGPGDLILAGDSNVAVVNSFNVAMPSGSISQVNAGRMIMRGGGTVPSGISTIYVSPGAAFTFDDSTGVSNSHLTASTSVNLSGGDFQLLGSPTTTINQSFTQFTNSQVASLTVVGSGATTTLSLTSLPRTSVYNTYVLRGFNGSSTFIDLSDTSGLVGGTGAAGTAQQPIIPFAAGGRVGVGIGKRIRDGERRTCEAAERGRVWHTDQR